MQNKSSERTYNFIDLFAGAGGLSEGFMQAVFSPIAHVEMNPYAAKTLETRTGYFYLKEQGKINIYYDYLKGNISREKFLEYIPERLLQSVICETMSNETLPRLFERIDKSMKEQGISHVDVIIGGPPCQAYSLVGRAQSSHMKVPMNEDPRNDLYKLYDENDYRQTIYFTRSTQSDSLGLNRKYQMGKHRSYVSDIFTLRTAEGYLNAAEACAMLGDAGAASGWLNRLRGKRIKDYEDVVYTADEIIEQVRVERRKELCLEGHRWLDLRRYAVCKKSPFKKIIERVYALYDWDGRSVFKYAEVYQLNVVDPAYVFAIPKAVLEFDKDMPDNIREDREYVRLMYRNNE